LYKFTTIEVMIDAMKNVLKADNSYFLDKVSKMD